MLSFVVCYDQILRSRIVDCFNVLILDFVITCLVVLVDRCVLIYWQMK